MPTRKHFLWIAVAAVVAGSAYLLLGHVFSASRHAASIAGPSPADPRAGRVGAPGGPAAAQPAPDELSAGVLRLEGQAIDKDKQPIGGATITLDGRRTITTEADGSFAFDRLADGEHRLVAEKDTLYAEDAVQLSASSEPATLTLQPGATLVLHVTAGGQPVAGAHVSVAQRKAETDRTGTVRYRGVELGATLATIAADPYAPVSARIATGDDPHAVIEQTIALGHAAPVAGVVVDQDGKPVAGAIVSYTMADSSWSDAVTADGYGRWRVEHLGAGKLVIRASSPKHITASDLIVPLDGDHPRTDVTVQVELGATISGVVVDTRGKPVADAEVTCTAGTASIDGHGRFEVTGLAAGEVFLYATTRTQGAPVQKLQIPRGGHVEARLVMSDATIAGRVKNQRGEPVAGAWVRAHSTTEDGTTSEVVTDEYGKFELTGLPAGRYQLVVGRDGIEDSPQAVEVHSGNRRVTLVLPEPAMITGRVLLDGKPVGYFGVKITDHPEDFLPLPDAVRSPDGKFAASGLHPGTWSLVIAGPDFARKIVPGVRVTDGHTTELGDIAAARGRSISGHVRDDRGQPVAGALVTISDSGLRYSDDEAMLNQLASGDCLATTDAHGAYHIDGIAPDATDLQIGATDNQRAAPPRPLPATGSTVDLVVARTGSITGVIVNERNRAGIKAVSTDGHYYYGRTDEDHQFVIPRVPPGSYGVEIYGTVTSPPTFVTVAADAPVRVRFEAPASPINLAVRIGAPTRCKQVQLLSVASNGIPSHWLRAIDCDQSTVEFTDLIPGPYHVCAEGHVCEDVEVAASSTRQRMTLRPAPGPR